MDREKEHGRRGQTTISLPTELMYRQEEAKEGESKQTTLRIQEKLHEEFKTRSIQTGLTVTSLLLVAIWWSDLGLKD